MEKTIRAKLKYLRIAPRKVQLVAGLLKGLSVNEAEAHLLMQPKRAALPLLKLLRSAIANAKNDKQLNSEKLFIKEIKVDKGPMFKRYMPRAMGHASLIQKKSSHITLVLGESEKLKAPRFKIVKPEKHSKKEKIKKIKKEEEAKKARAMEEAEKQKPVAKSGFIKKIFRRKTV
jgi:large subunit ribosomal protein L22